MSSLSQALSDLGPLFEVRETFIGPITATEVQLCTKNPLRWALTFGVNPPLNVLLFASTIPGNPTQAKGLLVAASNASQIVFVRSPELSFRQWGPLVQQAWYGGGVSTQQQNWTVMEVLLVPGVQG